MNFKTDIFTKFDKDWALLAAGSPEDHNAMTVSWGGMGTLWGKPVVTVYVRHSRHTYGYMENSEYFSLSFYGEAFKKALGVMGSKSGRDCDKDKEAGLTPVAAGQSVSYKEAEATLVCKKLYAGDLEPDSIPDDVKDTFYQDSDWHRMYIGEVVEIIEK